MRRLVIATSLLIGCGAACISDDSVQSSTPTYPVYTVRPERELTGMLKARRRAFDGTLPGYSASWYPRGRRISPRWTSIIIHHSGTATGGAKTFDKYHRQKNGWDELGYHFVIGNGTDTPDGHIEVGPRWHKQKHGAHCKTANNYYNEHGIGICLVGDFTRTRPTDRQLTSLNRLVRFLCDRCGIPPERIATHSDITRKTRCPGHRFKLAPLQRSLTNPRMATSMP